MSYLSVEPRAIVRFGTRAPGTGLKQNNHLGVDECLTKGVTLITRLA